MITAVNTPTPDGTTWYQPKKLAARMGVKPSCVYNAIKAGELRATCLNGRHFVIAAEWAQEWIARGVEAAERKRAEYKSAASRISNTDDQESPAEIAAAM